jgi:hypothetical protein
MIVLLTVLSALAVLAFVGVLIYFLFHIVVALEHTGGAPDSYLAKIGFGVRAIERETSHLAPQVTRLNQGLSSLAERLSAADRHLRSVAEALSSGGEVARSGDWPQR